MSIVSDYPVDAQLRARYVELEAKYEALGARFEEFVEECDVIDRCLTNPKMSPVYQKAYIFLIKTYPGLLSGVSTTICVHSIREKSGWTISKNSMTKFFQDMQAIGAFVYHSGRYEKEKEEREGYLVPGPDFAYPENFDTRSAEKRRKEREAESTKRKEWQEAWRVLHCEKCSSPDIKYGLIAVCGSCGHEHAPIEDIASERISIAEPEASEEEYPF